jgi:hypothetical protein
LLVRSELLPGLLDLDKTGDSGLPHNEVRNAMTGTPEVQDTPSQLTEMVPNDVVIKVFSAGIGHFPLILRYSFQGLSDSTAKAASKRVMSLLAVARDTP